MFKLQATIYNYRASNAKETFHNPRRITLYAYQNIGTRMLELEYYMYY